MDEKSQSCLSPLCATLARMSDAKFAAVYCVYHDDIWLPSSYESIYDAVDAVYFLVSFRPWNGPVTDNASTLECIESLPDPHSKKRLLRDNWDDQVVQRNRGLEILAQDGYEFNFLVDADEVYDTACLKNMMQHARTHPEVDVWHTKFVTYWKSVNYRIDPAEDYDPPIFIRTDGPKFVEFRNPIGTKHELVPLELGFCHHLSYARSDDLVWRKINSFSAAPQIKSDWFEQVWKGWDNNHEMTNLHPVRPQQYQRAVPMQVELLPPVLRKFANA